ncbi:hypothetical protein RHGRI_027122 [Rhododendron griersonianum]|uniref:Uncharacterized protein n=1 Tax=Rhododendron griersonianum TaxID=479676 RepID=A0AAV6IWN3_9ERIC|nr:hypothetical protein RHGRI_027122 [Rhododendron griersonianum]
MDGCSTTGFDDLCAGEVKGDSESDGGREMDQLCAGEVEGISSSASALWQDLYSKSLPDEVFPPLQHFGKLCIAKLDEVFPQLQRFGKICIAKVGEVFPPEITAEQMKYWVQVATPYIIGAVVILILLCFFCGGGGGSKAKTMKAPGTGRACKIPRPSFEASPKSYFRGLRGK